MNVSAALWDAMVSINPSDAHVLTREELDGYGLSGIDPVEDEMRRQGHAKALGISVEEYLRREALIKQRCVLQSTGDFPSKEEFVAWELCTQHTMSNGD